MVASHVAVSLFTDAFLAGSRGQFAQHVMENTAIPVVFELIEGIDAAQQRHLLQ